MASLFWHDRPSLAEIILCKRFGVPDLCIARVKCQGLVKAAEGLFVTAQTTETAIFVSIVGVAIVIVGYLFNWIL